MRDVKAPFRITPTEQAVLAMLDRGFSPREINEMLGRRNQSQTVPVVPEIATALEKRRVILLDNRKPMGHSRLTVARGNKRMVR